MKLAPLQVYHEPEYPTQEALRHHPELLRVLPRRWRGKQVVLSALAGVLALISQSCADPYRASWGRTMGKVAIPQSPVPEDEAKSDGAGTQNAIDARICPNGRDHWDTSVTRARR